MILLYKPIIRLPEIFAIKKTADLFTNLLLLFTTVL